MRGTAAYSNRGFSGGNRVGYEQRRRIAPAPWVSVRACPRRPRKRRRWLRLGLLLWLAHERAAGRVRETGLGSRSAFDHVPRRHLNGDGRTGARLRQRWLGQDSAVGVPSIIPWGTAEFVGQTPWSLDPLFGRRIKWLPRAKTGPGGRPQRGPQDESVRPTIYAGVRSCANFRGTRPAQHARRIVKAYSHFRCGLKSSEKLVQGIEPHGP